MNYDIKNINLANAGKKRIEWAEKDMPVLKKIMEKFEKEKPFAGKKMSCCLHVTCETANLMRTLKAGGADVILCASNPLSTQDDVAASLARDYEIPVFAIHGEDKKMYYNHLNAALDHKPEITMDDGADLISLLHSDQPASQRPACAGGELAQAGHTDWAKNILGSMEETTTGVIRLKALEKSGKLKVPIIAVNDAKTKNLFDNRYGTGQSTIDGIIRATDILLAGKNVVAAGYGWCGRGFAMRARGMGAKVIITEVDKIKALEAAMDGFQVMPMNDAAKIGDLFCTLTGDIHVIRKEHFEVMKDGAIVCNSGHFDVEIDIPALEKMADKVNKNARHCVDEYIVKNKKIYILAEGRLVNLAAAEGHPASVMDMSFATQALAAEYIVKNSSRLDKKVYNAPEEIENYVAELKLESMGVRIDKLTSEQEKYLSSWEMGT